MWSRFCGWLLRTMGWTSDSGPAPDKKCILLGVPHTSIWDFVVAYLFYRQFPGKRAYCMVKKEFFFWPMCYVVRAMGGIPTDRSNATTLVKSIITAMEEKEEFTLAIAPEGTRKPIRKWKTGYHTIARAAGIPVYLCYFNWGDKHIGIWKEFPLTDDARGDTDRLQQEYETLHLKGRNPEGFITH